MRESECVSEREKEEGKETLLLLTRTSLLLRSTHHLLLMLGLAAMEEALPARAVFAFSPGNEVPSLSLSLALSLSPAPAHGVADLTA